MEEIRKVKNISQANSLIGKETEHPLVSVIDFSKHEPMKYERMNLGFYGVFLKYAKDADLHYGRNQYDYQEDTLVFIAPGQVVSVSKRDVGEFFQPSGWALMFHPDLLHGTPLSKRMKEYSFFSYDVHEALHLSEQEKRVVLDCFHKIEMEIKRSVDKHSKMLIVSNIELFLNYCIRFYDRQFITRDHLNKDVIARFQKLLDEYFDSDNAQARGLPSVAHFAAQLHLSANYFGDLIKKETGSSAQEHIQSKIIEAAKEKIFDTGKSVSEIAYELGFKFPQHFIRIFKQKVGHTPNEYRNSIR